MQIFILTIVTSILAGASVVTAQIKHPDKFRREEVVDFLTSIFGKDERVSKVVASFEANNALHGMLMPSLTKDDRTKVLGLSPPQSKKFQTAVDQLMASYKNIEAKCQYMDLILVAGMSLLGLISSVSLLISYHSTRISGVGTPPRSLPWIGCFSMPFSSIRPKIHGRFRK